MDTNKIITNDFTPLGVNFLEETQEVEFKLFSKNATKVFLCIFDKPQGEEAILTLELEKKEENIWQTKVKNYVLNCENKPIFYGYRLFGPNWEFNKDFELNSNIGLKIGFDKNSNRFNPNKIAFDPYSKELSHTPSESYPISNAFSTEDGMYLANNAKWAVKSVYIKNKPKEITKTSLRPFKSEIIGEVHIKDLTQNLTMSEKGTYKGAGKFAKSIKNLGITMVEFLPLNEFDSKQNGLNHWGYMPLNYFSLAKKYAFNKDYGKILDEFSSMIDEFHKNDIKVCLDMVYNHTGEGGLKDDNPNNANLFSYALIDNSSYYKTFENGFYRSNSGCGNDFNIANKNVSDLIVDSLVFFINQGVDAFRFDLAAALLENSTNTEEVFDSCNSLAGQLKEKLKKRGIKVVDDFNLSQDGVVLIAEPWTCGGKNSYQLGKFPSFWGEWNDCARDILRKITLKPNELTPFDLKEVLEGTPSVFKRENRSINYIASHDGFSLYDLNNFSKKSSSTQGGSDWEICGDYNHDLYYQQNAIRKQLAFLFLSYGIPMIQIGDIIMHSKNGNNNSYNKDDQTNYLNWLHATKVDSFENRMMEYTRNLIKFRKENIISQDENFIDKLTYHYDNGLMADLNNEGYWKNKKDLFFGALYNLRNNRIYVATNKKNDNLEISLPENKEGTSWYICLDSSNFKHITFEKKDYIEKSYILKAQALAIFMES